jgi:alanine racemase
VKADGYGHGAIACARAALAGGASFLTVATAAEGAALRDAGTEVPILVSGPLVDTDLDLALEHHLDVVAWSEGFLRDLLRKQLKAQVPIHVKLDTGMGRLGTRELAEADRLVELTDLTPELKLRGVMTHFATADESGSELFTQQLELFRRWAERIKGRYSEVIVHAANSAATIRDSETHFDMVRCGIALYGLDPFISSNTTTELDLKPALTLTSYVAAIKECKEGESVGYGATFTAQRDTWVAAIPIGYADGVRRSLSNNGSVLIDGIRYPIVGTISMDSLTIDLGESRPSSAAIGSPAVLIGGQGGASITAEEIAANLNTINYEIVCGISARVVREY